MSGVRQALARVPGLRSAVAWARRAGSGREQRHLRELAELVRTVADGTATEVGVLAPSPAGLVDAVRAVLPDARVTELLDEDPARHLLMTRTGPFDLILDSEDVDRRRRRFEATFYHLRPGGSYVIPGGATEVGADHGPLGELLVAADEAPRERLRKKPRSIRANRRLAIKNHVTHRVVGTALVLTHDIPDVLVKMRDSDYNGFLRRIDSPHQVLSTMPAGRPPQEPEGVEGPEPRNPPMKRRIAKAKISLREYRDVVVAPRQVVVDGRVLLPDTFRHNQWPVQVNTQMIDIAERFAQPRTRIPADPPRLAGTYLHLDNEFRGHFGHLMTESLSRVWSWPEALAIDADAQVLLGTTHKRPRPLEYELQLYEAAGIPRDRIVVIDEAVRVERLISGTPMFSHPQYVHPRIAETWTEVGDRLVAAAPEREWPRRFFVGRRGDKRACLNGEDVEAIFLEHGFEIVYPEDYSLAEQAQLFRAAEVIGGYAGSGLFQIAFVPDPRHVIMVGPMSYTPRNEYLMAAVHGHRIDAVICQAEGRSVQSSYSFDLERDGAFLRSILEDLP